VANLSDPAPAGGGGCNLPQVGQIGSAAATGAPQCGHLDRVAMARGRIVITLVSPRWARSHAE
jgi:hypothetical protein